MGVKGSKERLSKQDIDFLKVNTRYDENTINEWYKGFMTDCPDGKLTPTSFMQIYSKCFPTGNANEFCDHVFRTFDSDKNGFIDFKEFLLAIDVTSSGSPEEKLNWAFSMYDVDGNGWIDLQEMTKIVKSIYNMMGPTQQLALDSFESPELRAEGIFKRMDINSDGRVTRQEFVRCCLDDTKLIELLTPHSTVCHMQ
eukprot:TRINITY_DN1747_c0_g1_i3.p1 TRINITY_DN1747_c0_g1~~TRINITY_DN1747_c0_g1_i3.p1  ORF type:complete len:197 (-),score=4.88 TRINITY_DN1747_c0_g1_i3:56-646(-)